MAIIINKSENTKPKLMRKSSANLGKIKLDVSLFDKFEIGGQSLKNDLSADNYKTNLFAETKKQANMPVNSVGIFSQLKEKINTLPVWGKVGLVFGAVVGAGLLLKGKR